TVMGGLSCQITLQTETIRSEGPVVASSDFRQQFAPRLASHPPQTNKWEDTPAKSRSPYGRGPISGISTARTKRHWALCNTITAIDADCLSEGWADRLIMQIEPLDDEEAMWRATISPEDCIALVEKSKEFV
ncbi:MAG: hypothetical protein ACKPKO_36610, partial [Candidatus Fonsibacter sp.]